MATYGQVLVNTQSGVGGGSLLLTSKTAKPGSNPEGNDVPSPGDGEGATTRETAAESGEGSTVGASEMASRSAKQLGNELKK